MIQLILRNLRFTLDIFYRYFYRYIKWALVDRIVSELITYRVPEKKINNLHVSFNAHIMSIRININWLIAVSLHLHRPNVFRGSTETN